MDKNEISFLTFIGSIVFGCVGIIMTVYYLVYNPLSTATCATAQAVVCEVKDRLVSEGAIRSDIADTKTTLLVKLTKIGAKLGIEEK